MTKDDGLPDRQSSMLRVLAQRDFGLLWWGQALSSVGNQMLPVALALLVLSRGYGVAQLGTVLAAQTFALGVGAVAATAIGDRWRRTRIMIVADIVRALAVAAIAATPSDSGLSVIVVLVVVIGVGEGLFQPAYQALIPRVVRSENLQPANALTSFSVHTALIAGPALAGVLAAAFGPEATLWIDAATFAASLLTLLFIREAAVAADVAQAGVSAVRRMGQDIREGIMAVVDRRWLAATIGSVTVITMFAAAPTLVLLPVIAREELGGDRAYGAVLAAVGVGALIGSIVAARVRGSRPGTVALGLSMLNALSMAGLALLALPGVMVTWALAGLGVTAFNVLWITALQRDVPDHLLGRVMALDWLGSTCFMPLGFLLAGPAVNWLGSTRVLLAATVITLVLTPLPLLVRGGSTFSTPASDQPRDPAEVAT